MSMDSIDSPFAVLAKYQSRTPVDLDAIAREFGVNVYRQDLGPETSGQIIRDRIKGGRSGFAIYVNSTHHPNRQRFTLAHEIAHYILHRDLIESGVVDDTMYRDSTLGSYYESQANRMAADILMPIRLVKAYIKNNPNATIDEMAVAFGVSRGAMEIRRKSIPSLNPQAELPL